jgi:hypothetical protein
VDVSVTWFDIQKGDVAEKDMPHGFLRLGSKFAAMPIMSDVRFV